MGSRLYVGNISWNTNDGDLTTHFSKYGEVKSARVIIDQATGKSKGFGFVEMGTEDEAQKAITSANGIELGGRSLRVSEAQERSSTNRTPRAEGRFGNSDRGSRPASYEARGENRFGGRKDFNDRY